MKKPFLIALALAAAPFAAQAETWNIYGWQNHSWEFVDIDGGRSFDRIQSNAGNIGFAASVPTGMNDISVNVRCEQFTYFNHFAGGTGWCNRNSKIGLSHPQMGEIMFATWLLPYNEGVAQWVDPFYDAGADSHTSIMGSVGAHTIFYNTGDFDQQASASGPKTGFSGAEFNYAGGGYDTGFNRRQENIIQYWSPNWNGFVFRFAWTAGNRDETPGLNGHEVDPVIRSSSLAYTNGPFWGAVTWQDHEDWTAVSVGNDDGAVMETSDAESIRVAGRYIMDLGDGMSVQISAMWEDLEYEFNGVTNVDAAMAAFGYGNFASSYTLHNADGPIEAIMKQTVTRPDVPYTDVVEDVWKDAFTNRDGDPLSVDDDGNPDASDAPLTISYVDAEDGTRTWAADNSLANNVDRVFTMPVEAKTEEENNDPLTAEDEGVVTVIEGNAETYNLKLYLEGLKALSMDEAVVSDAGVRARYAAIVAKVERAAMTEATSRETSAYNMAMTDADDAYMAAINDFLPKDYADLGADEKAKAEMAAANLAARKDVAGNVKIERDAWMVSGKIKFGGPVDFRFSYMDADDLEVSCASCSGDWDETAADAWNVGMFYTMPGGTELRLTYSEVDNDDNGTYGQGISGTGLGSPGAEIEMFAVGIVHWFD